MSTRLETQRVSGAGKRDQADSRFAHTLGERSTTVVSVRFTAYFLRLWETRGMHALQ